MAYLATASSSSMLLKLNSNPKSITRSSCLKTIKFSFSFSHLYSVPQLPCIRPRTLVEAKKPTFSSFEDLIDNSEKPVLVDFYATWCGPCQFMVSILNEVEESMQDKIKIVKVDTEKYPAIADKYKIQALPTFIVFKDGEPCERFEGALPADQLVKRIEAALEA